jgi:hypothetical protein
MIAGRWRALVRSDAQRIARGDLRYSRVRSRWVSSRRLPTSGCLPGAQLSCRERVLCEVIRAATRPLNLVFCSIAP